MLSVNYPLTNSYL